MYTSYFENAVKASRDIVYVSALTTRQVLHDVAAAAVAKTDYLLAENQKDLDRMDRADPKYDRLQLTASRIKDIAADMLNVADMDAVLGKTLSEKEMPNGLVISKMTVPLGVVGVIYEARPNVTFDVFALCFKTGNVSVLKGGSDADFSNRAIISIVHEVLEKHQVDINTVTLLPVERQSTDALLNATGYVDVLIPRGSQNLINYVRQHSRIPVIETGAGIVHVYFDKAGDIKKGATIINNAKTRRVSVCNALDCLLIDTSRLTDLPGLVQMLADKEVELYADDAAYAALSHHYPMRLLNHAVPSHYGTEFLSLRMAVRSVNGLPDALNHIAKHSSKHSEAIVTEDNETARLFLTAVDAAAVYHNASTAFTDGGQFGLGAEIGISTQKLHARGPMGLQELTSYKWIIKGDGQVR